MIRKILGLPVVVAIVLLAWGQVQSDLSLTRSGASLQEAPTEFLMQTGTPVQIPNFVQPDAGCSWTGVGGQVFNQGGEPVTGIVIRVTGSLNGSAIDAFAVSGGSIKFGAGGYEIELARSAVASKNTLYMQLIDLGGAPRSPLLALETSADCSANL